MESWRKVFREGIAPQLPVAGLEALAKALQEDDPRLCQGSTTYPPPLQCFREDQVEHADAIAFAYWQAEGLEVDGKKLMTVGELEDKFALTCYECDNHFGEPTACRWYLNWFDDTPRDEMRRLLLPEVQLAITNRVGLEVA